MTNQYPDVLSILEAVAAVPGKLDKLAILEANKENKTLQNTVYLALNGLISFYIKKLPTATKHESNYTLDAALALLPIVLAARQKTGHAAIEWVQHLLEQCSERDAEVVRRVIGRDLRMGAGDGSADKVWPGLVPRFAVMLATSYSDKALAKIKYPAYAQLKADGSRTQVIVDLDMRSVFFYTRNGKDVFLSETMVNKMLAIFPSNWTGKWVVDGEIVALVDTPSDKPIDVTEELSKAGKYTSKVIDRATGNGIYNKAIKGSISPEEESKLNFQVWDLIPYDEWTTGKGTMHYKDRLFNLRLLNHTGFTTVIETHTVYSLAEAEAIYTTYIEQDLEGIILKNLDGLWEDKRSKDQVKFKQVMSADLEVVEVMLGKEGKKYAEIAGTLRCTTSCRQVFVDASGMSDAQRKLFWDERGLMVGKIVEIEYNGIVKRRGATVYSLFLPQFVQIRDDKTEANSLDELQIKKSNASLK